MSRGAALRTFAALELGIAAFGIASSWIYYDWLYGRAGWLYSTAWGTGSTYSARASGPG